MKYNKFLQCMLVITACTVFHSAFSQVVANTLYSPDKRLMVAFSITNKQALYKVMYNGKEVLLPSKLGVVREDEDFSTGVLLSSSSAVTVVNDNYTMNTAKRNSMHYQANKKSFHLTNAGGKKMDVIFQVSNDGVAFRYFFPDKSTDVKRITKEVTTYHFPDTAKAWIQPMSIAKSGWEHTNPSYEEHYLQNISVGTPSPLKSGWVYPALFRSNNTWLLITEAALDSTFCGTRLNNDSASGEYKVDYPTAVEVITGGGAKPQSALPWYSPWRIITIGSLKTIVESTLGTDLAKPAVSMDASFVRPGKAAWSWINSKDNFIIFSEQKKYIDFAADMHWQYCLIDADWDRKIGYDSVKILADYARLKNIGLLLWYNSSGDWNTVRYTPKNKMLTPESRAAEFSRLQAMGIKGVKIDFFGGDGQSMIKYYQDIMVDAAKYKLTTNFHGATLPRGWARTYPNLVTAEAIRGFEFITFEQPIADEEANHCSMLPFTRNAFDPMDFTPMNLYKIQTRVKRKTTSAFELALSVLFLSGVQHYAESPEGMKHAPEYVKDFLRTLPDSWEDVRYITGFPGKDVVIARKKGNKWYVAGINGEATNKTFTLDLSFLPGKKGQLIEDGSGEDLFSQKEIPATNKTTITVKPNGGFVAAF